MKDFLGNALRLRSLQIVNSTIKSIDENSFVTANKLEELTLSFDKIEQIDKDAFKNLTALNRLDLSNNQLTRVDPGWFQDLKNLTVLLLDNNQLTEIQDETFKNAIRLIELSLRNNILQEISKNAFTSLNLKQLDLSSNTCTDIDFKTSKELLRQLDYIEWDLTQLLDSDTIKDHRDKYDRLRSIEKLPQALARCRKSKSVCKYPMIQNGHIESLSKILVDGENIVDDETVRVLCDEDYNLLVYKEEDNEVTCENGVFNKKFPPCNFGKF